MDKACAIINYIINAFQAEPKKLSKVKLAKILWFADKEYMYKYYTSLSGLEYIKLPQGPVPKNYDKLLKDMENKAIIHTFDVLSYGKKQICFHSLKEPDLEMFKAQEISILDKVISDVYNQKSTTLSKKTHDELWDKVKMGEIMPIESVFWQDIIPPNDEDIKQALQDLKKGLECR